MVLNTNIGDIGDMDDDKFASLMADAGIEIEGFDELDDEEKLEAPKEALTGTQSPDS